MKCGICGSEVTLRKKYGGHVAASSLKTFIKKSLPYVDFLIPRCIPKLKRYSSKRSPFKGDVCICSKCGHGVLENPPTEIELQRYYQEEYWSDRSTSVEKAVGENDDSIDNPRAIHQIGFALKHINCAEITDVLEVGAGAAYASLLLRHQCKGSTVNLHVCEPGMQWEDYYRKQGIERIASFFPFETAKRFDYVHTSHWLEHVRDLDATLSVLNALINPSGSIFVEVPNTEHFYWDLPIEDVPHIQFFTRGSLVEAFKKHNFDCLDIGEYGITYLERQKGISVTPDRYGACERGFWIRGLFKKAG